MLTPPWALAVAFQNSIFLPECIPKKMPVLADGTLCKSLQGHVHIHRLGLHLIVGFHAVALQQLPGSHYRTPAMLHESHHTHWVNEGGAVSQYNSTYKTTQWTRSHPQSQLLTLQKSYISVHTSSSVIPVTGIQESALLLTQEHALCSVTSNKLYAGHGPCCQMEVKGTG